LARLWVSLSHSFSPFLHITVLDWKEVCMVSRTLGKDSLGSPHPHPKHIDTFLNFMPLALGQPVHSFPPQIWLPIPSEVSTLIKRTTNWALDFQDATAKR
jgi:hypothetical protein